jgi:hypothetical protein
MDRLPGGIDSGHGNSAGEAVLLYADKQGGPSLPSLRLKLIQKGIDDFGYLQVLQRRLVADAKRKKMTDPEKYGRTEMQKVASPLVRDIDRYWMDTAVLADTRRAIAHRIEARPHQLRLLWNGTASRRAGRRGIFVELLA